MAEAPRLFIWNGSSIPFHEKDSGHQTVGDKHTHTWEVGLVEIPPQALVKTTDSVVCVGGALSIGYTIEEVTVICPLLPHSFHLGRTRLEVAKVLLS